LVDHRIEGPGTYVHEDGKDAAEMLSNERRTISDPHREFIRSTMPEGEANRTHEVNWEQAPLRNKAGFPFQDLEEDGDVWGNEGSVDLAVDRGDPSRRILKEIARSGKPISERTALKHTLGSDVSNSIVKLLFDGPA
jgi:hypothetical protein